MKSSLSLYDFFSLFFLKIAQSAQSGGRSEFAQFHAREEPLLYELNVKCHKYGTSLYSQRLVHNDRFYQISSRNQSGFFKVVTSHFLWDRCMFFIN